MCVCTSYICALFWQMPINMYFNFFNGIIGKFNYIQLSAIFFDIRKTNIILLYYVYFWEKYLLHPSCSVQCQIF